VTDSSWCSSCSRALLATGTPGVPTGDNGGGFWGVYRGQRVQNLLIFRCRRGVQVPLLAFRARSAGSGNRSRFSGSSRVLSGRFRIDSRLRLCLVPFRSPRSCAVLGFRALFVLSKFESPPLRLDSKGGFGRLRGPVHVLCTSASAIARKAKLGEVLSKVVDRVVGPRWSRGRCAHEPNRPALALFHFELPHHGAT
jgi:hypothetical protein